uniref:Uncharacterized protein n=1 Tax=Arundo donax TaxID=35708 RepID=A0A0A9EC49_ARUDO
MVSFVHLAGTKHYSCIIHTNFGEKCSVSSRST